VPAGQSGSGAVLQRLYNQYIEHYKLAEEVGFDGIMLNEHHNAPFCMQAKCNVFASILAAITERVKIVLLGNPLPLAENPCGWPRSWR
jgi:alkanesulfonate monooxygenase SsuD/methylene tetrahydromethanopterin reductase-like flavin-dependent oxidoreductase (luciferase family)